MSHYADVEEYSAGRAEMFKLLLGGYLRITKKTVSPQDWKDAEGYLRKLPRGEHEIKTDKDPQAIEEYYMSVALLATVSGDLHDVTTNEALGVRLAKIQHYAAELFEHLFSTGLWREITPRSQPIDIVGEMGAGISQ